MGILIPCHTIHIARVRFNPISMYLYNFDYVLIKKTPLFFPYILPKLWTEQTKIGHIFRKWNHFKNFTLYSFPPYQIFLKESLQGWITSTCTYVVPSYWSKYSKSYRVLIDVIKTFWRSFEGTRGLEMCRSRCAY